MKLFYRKSTACFFIAFLVIVFSSGSADAQHPSSQNTENGSKIGLSAVYSPNSFAAWGKIRNSQSFSLKGQLWYYDLQYNSLDVRLGSELIITQHLNYPLNGIDGPRDERFGFGLIPANVLIPFGSSSIKPFVFFSAGLLFLNEKLPAIDGASMNFLLNLGTGFEFSISERINLQLGYSLQHLSNANSAGQNPGIDYHNIFMTLIL